ncbi:MAG: aldo/keto reductase, partial [Candidatus Odyssella sp.]|nr:aldo/keto reductase [Candidatus Odyssella sp.]
IFYHHRPDPDTPLEETMAALAHVVRQGKALHVGLSKYPVDLARQAAALLRQMGTPCLIHQLRYSMLERAPEDGQLAAAAADAMGVAAFSPLAQGLLTDKYLAGVPGDARMARGGTLPPERLTPDLRARLARLDDIARGGRRSLAQLALVWLLRDPRVTTLVAGARTVAQLDHALDALTAPTLADGELAAITAALG